jgi:hypothetical protein
MKGEKEVAVDGSGGERIAEAMEGWHPLAADRTRRSRAWWR